MLSVSAAVVALCALGVSTFQAVVMRQQLKQSAWPYVTQENTGGDTAYAWRVVNSGIGPALVRRATVTVAGKPVRDWGEFYLAMARLDRTRFDTTTLLRDHKASRVITSSILRGSVLLPGTTTELIRVTGPFGRAQREMLNDPRVAVRFCYCSLYDDCWVSVSGTVEPSRTGECTTGEDFSS